jgi:hypothetical protein
MNCDVGRDEMIRRAEKFRRRPLRVARSRKFESAGAGLRRVHFGVIADQFSTVSRAFDRGSGV